MPALVAGIHVFLRRKASKTWMAGTSPAMTWRGDATRPESAVTVADPILCFEDVVVAFGALRAVDGVTMAVSRGERRAIIGPNGAGKTTLFNAATGVIRPTDGRVVFDAEDLTRLPPYRRAWLGISRTFQITNLFPTLAAAENMALAVRGLTSRKFSLFGAPALDAKEATAIEHALAAVRLADRANTIVRELSYGEQRQLELALALVGNPRLLLLDEPAAGLSPSERAMVGDIIRSLPRDLTLILIEHDMDLALALVDQVTCMHEGRIIAEGVPEMIRRDVLVQEVYLGKPRDA
jgi:branched-chain amino acid transport system ATP-binding protein